MNDNLRPILGFTILMILVFVAGRFWKKKDSSSSQYDEWKTRVQREADKEEGQVAVQSVQESRATLLREAFEHRTFGLFAGTDEIKIYDVFRGFMSIDDFVRFDTYFNSKVRWAGMTLTQALQSELDVNEYGVLNTIMLDNLGITLLINN